MVNDDYDVSDYNVSECGSFQACTGLSRLLTGSPGARLDNFWSKMYITGDPNCQGVTAFLNKILTVYKFVLITLFFHE